MSVVLDRYQLVTPATLAEVLADLEANPQAKPFAGGTDLMVLLEAGHLPPGRYVSLAECRDLMGIERDDDGSLAIGALTTYTEIRASSAIDGGYALLKRAAAETGGLATQNRGTIGGNIANASPAADTPPVLLVYDAELELLSASGTRRVPYASFHRGYKQMDLAPGEIIARVLLPPRLDLPPEAGSYRQPADTAGRTDTVGRTFRSGSGTSRDFYRKVGTRRAQAISKVCFAGTISIGAGVVHDVRIALGSVAPTVIRARRTEDALAGRVLDAAAIAAAMDVLASEIAPIDDIRSTARYRARVAANLLRQFLTL